MKKLITAAVLAVVCAGLAFALFLQKRLTKTDVAMLLPAETVLLLHLPDVARTRDRWKKTALAHIAAEPEVVAFLERPKSKLPQLALLQAHLDRALSVDPREAFAAITSLSGPGNLPRFVGGFSFSAEKEAVEAVIADVKKPMIAAWPAGRSDLVQHNGVTIETFTAEGWAFAGAFVKDWYLFSNDGEQLKATIDRLHGGKGENPLRKTKLFASLMARMTPQFDSLVFMQPKLLVDRAGSLMAAAGLPPNPRLEELRKIEALGATTKLDGIHIRDTMFVVKSGVRSVPELPRRSLVYTSPDTLLYYAALAQFAAPGFTLPDSSLDATGILRQLEALGAILEQQGLGWGDFAAAFGPEFTLALDWSATAMQPGLILSLDVRDAERAKKLVDTLTESSLGGTTWGRQTIDGTAFYALTSQGIAFISPTFALTDKLLVFGLNFDTAKTAISRLKVNEARLDTTADFNRASATVHRPTAAFGYIEGRALFERVYGTARSFAIMGAAFAPKLTTYVDVNKLPTTEAISKHLGPIVFSQSVNEDGLLTESVGPVTFGQGAVAIGAAAVAAAIPALKARADLLPGSSGTAPTIPGVPQPPPSGAGPEPEEQAPEAAAPQAEMPEKEPDLSPVPSATPGEP